MENPSMHLGMKRFHAAIEHFGKAGELRDVLYRNAGLTKQFRRPAGRNQFYPDLLQLTGELYEPGFIGDTENCALHFRHL